MGIGESMTHIPGTKSHIEKQIVVKMISDLPNVPDKYMAGIFKGFCEIREHTLNLQSSVQYVEKEDVIVVNDEMMSNFRNKYKDKFPALEPEPAPILVTAPTLVPTRVSITHQTRPNVPIVQILSPGTVFVTSIASIIPMITTGLVMSPSPVKKPRSQLPATYFADIPVQPQSDHAIIKQKNMVYVKNLFMFKK